MSPDIQSEHMYVVWVKKETVDHGIMLDVKYLKQNPQNLIDIKQIHVVL